MRQAIVFKPRRYLKTADVEKPGQKSIMAGLMKGLS